MTAVCDRVTRAVWFTRFIVPAVIGWAWASCERVYDRRDRVWDGEE